MQILQEHFGKSFFADYSDMIIAGVAYEPKVVRTKLDRVRYWCAPKDAFIDATRIKCIHGHISARKYDYAFPDNVKVTWLRDPLRRAISHYKYWRRVPSPKHPVYVDLLKRGFTFDAFVKEKRLQNVQSLFLDGTRLENYAFVGITEEYEKSMRLFRAALKIKEEITMHKINVAPDRGQVNVNKRLVDLFFRVNGEDIDLYERAKIYFSGLCEQYRIS